MKFRNTNRTHLIAAAAIAVPLTLSACSSENQLAVSQGGVGVNITRSACPIVAVPAQTGDITYFNPTSSRDASAIDVVANITNVRSNCNETGDKIYSTASFDVLARRNSSNGARSVTIPYFSTVMRGGTAVVSKRLGSVTLNFADGAYRAQAQGSAGAYVDRTAATLPDDVRDKLTRRRRNGDVDAAVDPLTDPTVRAAVNRATFELLVGFQLTQDQLQYNATR